MEGGAVVAKEVRKLAEKSQLVIRDIDNLPKEGVSAVEIVAIKLLETISEIEKTVYLVKEIAVSSVEQNTGTMQVNSAVQQLNTVTQQNASVGEELAASAEGLAGQTEQLKEIISFFNITYERSVSFNSCLKCCKLGFSMVFMWVVYRYYICL